MSGRLAQDDLNYTALRTLRALELLAFSPSTAPRLAEDLQVHCRTARRLLRQLHGDGWLSYGVVAAYRYAPTLRVVALGAQIAARSPLLRVAAPLVEGLRADTGLTATLSIPAYAATVCLLRCSGAGPVHPPLGLEAPAHCTAAGKVLLAYREAWRRSVLRARLGRWTDQTITDVRELERQLAQVRSVGYAIDEGEHAVGVRRVAAPVWIAGAEVIAAIAVEAADGRPLDSESRTVRCAARAVSERLQAAGFDGL